MTAEKAFNTELDRLIGGDDVSRAEFDPELRLAALLLTSRPAPSPEFAAALDRRLAAPPARARMQHPRLAWTGGLAAALLLAVFTVSPARAGVASAIAGMLRVFVGEEPDVKNVADDGGGERPARPAELAIVEQEAPGALVPTELPAGFEFVRASKTDNRSGSYVQVNYVSTTDGATLVFAISVLEPGFDFVSQGSAISGNGVVGTLDRLNDRVGTNVLSWTDGRYLYQIFAPLSPEALLRIAGSAK